MIILPAIDLKDGRCVRLRQGVASDATVYNDDPVAQALEWKRQGARQIHVVDLDGAFQGRPAHTRVIAGIVAATGLPVEVGGGLRSDADVEALLALGVARAILGTRALGDPDALARLVARHPGRVAVGIDARDGLVQVKGWVETSAVRATDLAARVAGLGAVTLIHTDTATDGMLAGPNLAALDAVCAAAPGCPVIASGGVSSAAHVRALSGLRRANLFGAIVGKALYDGKTTLAELHAALPESEEP
ncbi:MAG: 1-(5-phosphoribosyl)-5-[(5-phosphoribosylamino)methylideneamino]imidazole-4-carboxamide isomerase [Kiritimatiellaeota bacterium]|nr:1-(5-phosphoribosyl)-5-[(5-phosphoribosylamino)methylideneamino]imidazole-4-carboxamide isomerase [Kiritimatiellota bacterium]